MTLGEPVAARVEHVVHTRANWVVCWHMGSMARVTDRVYWRLDSSISRVYRPVFWRVNHGRFGRKSSR